MFMFYVTKFFAKHSSNRNVAMTTLYSETPQ